jgi:hypothetical protein
MYRFFNTMLKNCGFQGRPAPDLPRTERQQSGAIIPIIEVKEEVSSGTL